MNLFSIKSMLCVFFISTALSETAMAAGQTLQELRQVRANEKIYIENMRGRVDIVAVASNQFRVTGTLDEKAEGFELTSADGFTRFTVKMPKMLHTNWGDLGQQEGSNLKIEVPTGSEVEFSGVNTNISVLGVQGASRIRTVNGAIDAQKLAKEVSLETVNGAISSRHNAGRLQYETVNGQIDDENSTGRMHVSSVNGEVTLKSQPDELELQVTNGKAKLVLQGTQRLELNSVNGAIITELQQSLQPRLIASNVNGKLELKVESQLNARVKMISHVGGKIENQLTSLQASKAQYGPRKSLEFSLGQGEGSIEMTTVGGGMKLSGF